ncbi:hypothetical protein ACP4OV_027077 [Aristida adscensionis]
MFCWPAITNTTMAAAGMFSKLSDKLTKLVCGASPPPDDDAAEYRAGLSSLLLLSPSPERPKPRRSSSSEETPAEAPPEDDDDEDKDDDAMAAAAATARKPDEEEDETAPPVLPCLAFASEHGYKVFSYARRCMYGAGEVRLRVAPGRRLVPSPRGGAVLATDVCYRHPCRLVDPFTGEVVAALPDLPVPRSETEPVPCRREEPRPRCAVATDDGLAWDWSPRGVMVARGDTAFFRAHGGGGGGGGGWTPVHQSRRGSAMSVNYRAGTFFLLEFRSVRVTAIDAGTLRRRAEVPPPPGVADIDVAYLAPLSDAGDVLLLVRRAGDAARGMVFSEAYRARLGGRRPARWARTEDIGDRAVFVDGAHGFAVDTGRGPPPLGNCVYVTRTEEVAPGVVRHGAGVVRLDMPEKMARLGHDLGEVGRMWGQPHWIVVRKRREEADRAS